jgi:hypothetical protein
MNRRSFLTSTLAAAGGLGLSVNSAQADTLPLAKTFIGQPKFQSIVAKAMQAGWGKLAMPQRMGLIAMEFKGTPYVGYTLEIDDHIEAPSVNCNGLDCWTFFEVVMGMARMLERPRAAYTPEDLLAEIRWTRYRAGICTGSYLQRIHYLNEWWFDNEARGNIIDLTKAWGVHKPLAGRESREMTKLWKSYRYLKNNPGLRPKMAELEAEISSLPVFYIPKEAVPKIEAKIQTGDILGIVTKHQGGVCSHVGLAIRSASGQTQIMHASSNFKRVVNEGRVSDYLQTYTAHLGLMIARPLSVSKTITDFAAYKKNLRGLTGGIIVE